MIDIEKLLSEYNRQATTLLIDRIRINELRDMLETLVNESILSWKQLKGGKKAVRLEVELSELRDALNL